MILPCYVLIAMATAKIIALLNFSCYWSRYTLGWVAWWADTACHALMRRGVGANFIALLDILTDWFQYCEPPELRGPINTESTRRNRVKFAAGSICDNPVIGAAQPVVWVVCRQQRQGSVSGTSEIRDSRQRSFSLRITFIHYLSTLPLGSMEATY